MKIARLDISRKIGVQPAGELHCRKRLFHALEQAYPVTFIDCSEGQESALSAVISFEGPGDTESPLTDVPILRIPVRLASGAAKRSSIRFLDDYRIDKAFRGRRLVESCLQINAPLSVNAGTTVFATADGRPIWSLQEYENNFIWRSALFVPELEANEFLRDRFRYASFASLLPLVHFLKDCCHRDGWSEPPLRAAFIIDDPNLHSSQYGYLRFRELAHHANTHHYHVAMAMIPLDGWFAHPKAIDIFRKSTNQLSLLIHGNNHVKHELAAFRSIDNAMSCLAQALRRVENFENRAGIPISRVLAPPHGVCSEYAIVSMLRLGFEGICVSRPYPWLQSPPTEMSLAGWFPADLVAGGFPVIPRYHLSAPRDDLIFRAFIGQPLILYGHHDDAAHGMEAFSNAARKIQSLGDVRWCSLEQIARSNFATRANGNCLYVRSYSNNINVTIPHDVSELVLTTPPIHGAPQKVTVTVNGSENLISDRSEESDSVLMRLPVLAGKASIAIRYAKLIGAGAMPAPPWRLWPIVRRIVTEGRDRFRPLFPGR